MNKSQKRVRPTFILLSLLVYFAIGGLLVFNGVPSQKGKIKAQVITEMSQSRAIAARLNERATSLGGIVNISNEFILDSLSFARDQTNASDEIPKIERQQKAVKSWYKTNASGDLIDWWQTPYRITLVGRTNFIITSAGRNLKFDDDDDLVFESSSKTFLKNPLKR